jgi:hypothetical protein
MAENVVKDRGCTATAAPVLAVWPGALWVLIAYSVRLSPESVQCGVASSCGSHSPTRQLLGERWDLQPAKASIPCLAKGKRECQLYTALRTVHTRKVTHLLT